MLANAKYCLFMKKMFLLLAAFCSIGTSMATTTDDASLAQKRATVMRINQENPNNCLVVTEMRFEQDSIPTEKADYTYDSDRNVASWFFYQRVDTGWLCSRYEFYDHVFLPNDTTFIRYTHDLNYDAGEWFPVSGFKQQTITNGNTQLILAWQTADGDSTRWFEYSKEQKTFDPEGRVIENISYSWQNVQWSPVYRYIYAYDELGRQILRQNDYWINGAWKVFDKYEVIRTDTTYFEGSYYYNQTADSLQLVNSVFERYDANGNKLLYIWGADGDRIYQKEEYSYENGLLTAKDVYKEAYYYPYDLELKEQYFYLYDTHNRVSEQKYLSYNYQNIYMASRLLKTYVSDDSDLIAATEQFDSICYDDKWVPVKKIEYSYTPTAEPLLTLEYTYNTDNAVWQYATKDEYSYNEDGMVLYFANYDWDDALGTWHGNYKQETEYNEEGIPVSDISYFMNPTDTIWTPERAVVRSFDVYGNFLGEGWYGINRETGEWVNMGKQLFVYICGDIPTPAQPVIVEPGHDFVTFAWLSYEDADTYTLTILSSNRSDTIAIMNFNSFGELIGQKAPLGVKRRTAEPSSSSVFTCLIEGLEEGTNYYFVMEAKNAQEQVLHTENGTFNTDGTTAIESVETENQRVEKMLLDGKLLIRKDNQWFNAQGQRIK